MLLGWNGSLCLVCYNACSNGLWVGRTGFVVFDYLDYLVDDCLGLPTAYESM
jgi:hypothetical protein